MENLLDELSRTSPLLFDVLLFSVLLLAYYWLRALRLAREGVRYVFKNLFYLLAAGYLIVLGLLIVTHVRNGSPNALVMLMIGLVFLVFGVHYLNRSPPPRRRHIPRKVRRAVIARDLGAEKFDSTKHHIDHRWPFSKGGSHTADNLRVIAKKRNLKKGAKLPTLRDLW